jgi:hypothetical protein
MGDGTEDGNSPAATSQSCQGGGPLPGIGGLFANGMPTLRKTQGGITTGRPHGVGIDTKKKKNLCNVAKFSVVRKVINTLFLFSQ